MAELRAFNPPRALARVFHRTLALSGAESLAGGSNRTAPLYDSSSSSTIT